MGILPRQIYKTIEHYLYSYPEIKKELQDEEADIIHQSSRSIINAGRNQSSTGDPTAEAVINLSSPELEKKRKWQEVIERTIERYKDTPKGAFLQKKYFEKKNEIQICYELYIDRSTFYNWRKEIVIYTAFLAVQEGIIKC